MKKSISILLTLSFVIAFVGISNAGGPPAGNFWADGTAYRTVVTPSKLPNKGPKDGLYVFDGLNGQSPVSESKPGDADYNGGRWQVYVLEFTEEGLAAHDANGDGAADLELTSWEEVHMHMG